MSTRTVRSTATALILRTLPSPEPNTDTGKRLHGGQTTAAPMNCHAPLIC